MAVDGYNFGKITIDGQTYSRDVIISPGKVWDGWWREEGHSLSVVDLEEAFKSNPKVLVVGTGFFGLMQVPMETRQEVQKRGIEFHALPTRKALRVYNQIASSKEGVVAAFHLSC